MSIGDCKLMDVDFEVVFIWLHERAQPDNIALIKSHPESQKNLIKLISSEKPTYFDDNGGKTIRRCHKNVTPKCNFLIH